MSKFSYKSVKDLVYEMQQFDYIPIVDIQDTYRAVAIHTSDKTFQGIKWYSSDIPEYYTDNRLCMGLVLTHTYLHKSLNFLYAVLNVIETSFP